jgi:hypothetical protein
MDSVHNVRQGPEEVFSGASGANDKGCHVVEMEILAGIDIGISDRSWRRATAVADEHEWFRLWE